MGKKPKIETPLGKRLQQIIDLKSDNVNTFASEIGLKKAQTLYNVINRAGPLTNKTLKKITDRFKDVNPDYIRTGEGEPLNVKIDKGKESIDERLSRIKEKSLSYESKPKPDSDMVKLAIQLLYDRIDRLEKEVEVLKKVIGISGEEASKNDIAG